MLLGSAGASGAGTGMLLMKSPCSQIFVAVDGLCIEVLAVNRDLRVLGIQLRRGCRAAIRRLDPYL